jgi:hypothetical protein
MRITEIPAVMAAFSEQVTDLDGILLVQKFVKYYGPRTTQRVAECCRYTLVNTNSLPQPC